MSSEEDLRREAMFPIETADKLNERFHAASKDVRKSLIKLVDFEENGTDWLEIINNINDNINTMTTAHTDLVKHLVEGISTGIQLAKEQDELIKELRDKYES